MKFKSIFIFTSKAAISASCGGGSDSTSVPAAIAQLEGAFSGTLTGAQISDSFQLKVLPTGEQ
jgi:hypothetical protein